MLLQFSGCSFTKEEAVQQLVCRLNPKAYFRVSESNLDGSTDLFIYLYRLPAFRFVDLRNFRLTKTSVQFWLPSHCYPVMRKGTLKYLAQKDEFPVTNLKPTA